jgi:hypothetical protein
MWLKMCETTRNMKTYNYNKNKSKEKLLLLLFIILSIFLISLNFVNAYNETGNETQIEKIFLLQDIKTDLKGNIDLKLNNDIGTMNAQANVYSTDTCSNDKSLYILYEDFESGILNTSLWESIENPIITSDTAYDGTYSLACDNHPQGSSGINCLKSIDTFGSDVGVLFYSSLTNNLDTYSLWLISPNGNSMITNYLDIPYTYGYYNGNSWLSTGIGRSQNLNDWVRIYWTKIGVNSFKINVTNQSNSYEYTTPVVQATTEPNFKLFFGTQINNGALNSIVYYDRILVWNTSIYGDTCPQNSEFPPINTVINETFCNATYIKGNFTDLIINWYNTTGTIPIYYSLYIKDINNNTITKLDNTTTNNYTFNSIYWNTLLSNNSYYYNLLVQNEYGFEDINSCSFNICQNNWINIIQPCISGTKFNYYIDSNNCSDQYNLPNTNNTYIECSVDVVNTIKLSDGQSILIILFIFLFISTICAIFVHEAFFGFNALITTLIWVVFRIYEYPTILMYLMPFMIIGFVVMWVTIHKVKH